MNVKKMYLEEDLFPREITSYENRNYGILFYNESNKDSFDFNHAICYLWPDGETAEKIYYEAGFRHVETKQAGRATYKGW